MLSTYSTCLEVGYFQGLPCILITEPDVVWTESERSNLQEPPIFSLMSTLTTLRLTVPIKTQRHYRLLPASSPLVFPAQNRISRLVFAATTISVLATSRAMSASTAGECANSAGPVPPRLQAMATDILQASGQKIQNFPFLPTISLPMM